MLNRADRIDRIHRAITLIEGERAAGTEEPLIRRALIDQGAQVSFKIPVGARSSTRGVRMISYCGVVGKAPILPEPGALTAWLNGARIALGKLRTVA